MINETRRGVVRIATNYTRLLITLSLGIVYVPLAINWVGFEAYGLIFLVASSIGFTNSIRYMTQQGMVRDLGAAWHDEDPSAFSTYYASAFVVSIGAAVIMAIAFALLLVFVDVFFVINAQWIAPARWMILGQAVYSIAMVLLAPTYSMYLVQERFTAYNLFNVLNRACDIGSVLILAFVFGITDTVTALTSFGLLVGGLHTLTLLGAIAGIIAIDRRLVPSVGAATRPAVKQIMHTFGWNGGVHAANAFYEFMPAVLLNHAYGLFGAAVWGAAWRLVAYVRMATMGMTYGLDAVSARISTVAGSLSIKELVHHSIKLQAFVALPTALVVFLLAQPLLQLWIGRELDDPAVAIPAAAVVAQILVFATTSRSIADGWMLILYGAGFVKRYAPMMLIGGLLSPVVSLVLLALMPGGEPYGPDFFAPAIGFAGVYGIFTMVLLPLIARRCLDVSLVDLMRPLGRPAIATVLLIPVALIAIDLVDSPWTLLHLMTVMVVMGVVYAVMAWPIVLNSVERSRGTAIVRSLLARDRGRAIPGRRCPACGHDLHTTPLGTPCPSCGGQQEPAQ